MSQVKKPKHRAGPSCPSCEFKLLDAHPFLGSWFRRSKARYPNMHISCAWRGPEAQNEALKTGASTLRWPLSQHNRVQDGKPCSYALDLFQIDEDGEARWSPQFMARLNADNEANHEPLVWGGKFKSLGDSCHFQYNPKVAG